jgi:hypothetical protein
LPDDEPTGNELPDDEPTGNELPDDEPTGNALPYDEPARHPEMTFLEPCPPWKMVVGGMVNQGPAIWRISPDNRERSEAEPPTRPNSGCRVGVPALASCYRLKPGLQTDTLNRIMNEGTA